MKPVDVLTEILIACPKDKVAEFTSNPDNAPKWYVNIKSAEWKTPKPLSKGSQIAFTAYFMRKKLEYIYEITEFIHGEKLVMRTAEGSFPMETTYTWEDMKDGTTRMTLRNYGSPSGFSALFAPLMVSAIKRANNKDLVKLKGICEKEL